MKNEIHYGNWRKFKTSFGFREATSALVEKIEMLEQVTDINNESHVHRKILLLWPKVLKKPQVYSFLVVRWYRVFHKDKHHHTVLCMKANTWNQFNSSCSVIYVNRIFYLF